MTTKSLLAGLTGAALLCAAGCVESSTTVKVKRDGSGQVVVTEYMAPSMVQMMSGMQGMGSAMGATNAPAAPNLADMFKESAEKKSAALGTGVTMTSFASATNAAGWVGYQAVYAFPKIEALNLAVGGDDAEDSAKAKYTCKFTPGAVAKLEIVPPPMPTEEPAATPATEPGAAAQPEMDPAAMMGMMAPMMKGMRMSLAIEVDGKIANTSATFKEGDSKVIVMDLPMDALLANPEGAKLIGASQGKKEMPLEAIRKLNAAGVKIEDPTKPLVIEFK